MNNVRQCDDNIDEVRDVFDVIERFSCQNKTPIIKNIHSWEQIIGGAFLLSLAISFVILIIVPAWLVYAGIVILFMAFAWIVAQILSFGIFYIGRPIWNSDSNVRHSYFRQTGN